MKNIQISVSLTLREPMLDKYMREIDKFELISPEEEVGLAELIKKGDRKALDQLTKANLRFVISVAKKYQGQGLALTDLINEGNLGLIEAARRFDPTRGFRFISYAVWHVRQHILSALGNHARIIKLPMNKVLLASRIYRSYCVLEQELERSPSAEEIAEFLNINPGDVKKILGLRTQQISLDSPLNDQEETNCLLDVLEDTSENKTETELYRKQSLKTELRRILCNLSERQKEVLCWFFGIGIDHPLSLDDIAGKMYLTTERVRQIIDQAIEKLRTKESINLLRGFLAA